MLIFAVNNSCKKDFSEIHNPSDTWQELKHVEDRDEQNPGEGPTILGVALNNPYALNVVKQAYANIYGQTINSLQPTHLYVRFLPSTPDEIGLLDYENREYWDFPLTYKITHLGERYQDPMVQDTNYTWLYTVVPVGFQFPQVQYEILEQIVEIPYETHLLKEAYRLTDNVWDEPDIYLAAPTFSNGVLTFVVPDEGGGVIGGGESGGPCGCPAPDHIRKPSGCVTVKDNMLNTDEPVRRVEVITARDDLGLLFVRRDETDDKGCFSISRKYHGKIRLWVKFKSDYCRIRTMTSKLDLQGFLFARKAYKGKFNPPNFNHLSIHFPHNTGIGSPDCCNWLAATANNALFDFRGWGLTNGVTAPPSNLEILITPWDQSGAAPMLSHMPGFTATLALLGGPAVLGVLSVFLPHTLTLLSPVIQAWIVIDAPDIVLNYNNPMRLNSDQVKEIAYHEFSHASHWQVVSNGYWQANVLYTAAVVTTPPFNDGPYGDGTMSGAGRCAVIEGWGYHMGATVSAWRYGINSNCHTIQNGGSCFGPSGGVSGYIRALESFNPNLSGDINKWIPKGIFHDLIDAGTEPTSTLVTDNVSGFTNGQMFSCINATSPNVLKDNIQALPGNSQQTAVATLFSSYGY